MSTSGSWNFSLTAQQIIQAAAEDLGAYRPGATIATAHSTAMLRRLNMLAKQWQGTSDNMPGMPIYTRQRVTLFLAYGQQTYTIGPAATDARATTQYGRTTISAAEAAGQTVLSVTSATDIATVPGTTISQTASDIIGIEQNDGTIHWSTIASTGAGPTITINDALAVAASAGNYVWWFTSRAQRFPAWETAVLRTSDNTDSEIFIYDDVRQYELGVSDKYGQGTPTAMLIEPLVTNTRITLDVQPTDVTDVIRLTVLYPAEDYDALTDDIAFPQEAYAALSWELALRCAPMFGVTWSPAHQKAYDRAVGLYMSLNPENSILYYQVE